MKRAGEEEAVPVDPEPEEKGSRAPPAGVPPQLLGAPEWPAAGRYAVLLPSSVVGYTELEVPLAWNQWAAGFLEWAPGFEAVRSVFRGYAAASGDVERMRHFVRQRDALGLSLHDGGTLPMAAQVELIREWEDGRLAIHVRIQDARYWRRAGARGAFED